MSFYIIGSDNEVVIDESCYFRNTSIYINGNKNKLIIDDNTNATETLIGFGTGTENRVCHIKRNNYLINMEICCYGANVNFTIGENCLLSDKITIMTSDGHDIKDMATDKIINRAQDMEIGDNCWIGKGVTILKSVKIPKNCIIGTNSVVTKSFDEENVIIAGNPAKIIKRGVVYKR